MIRAHVDALMARLEADPALSGNVIDGAADPNGDVILPPYVVLYVDSGTRSVERESSEQPTAAEFRIVTHSVGVDANQARYFAEKVMAQFLGWRPEVTGWAPQAVSHSRSQPAQADTSVNPAPLYITDVFKLTTRQA